VPLTWRVRVALAVAALLVLGVFVTGFWLNPYDAEGMPLATGTHQQLGLPPCSFKVLTGKPCPSCGMTTSVSLVLHGDVRASVEANWVGTVLVAFLAVVLPWAVVGVVRGRLGFVRSIERALIGTVAFFLAMLLLRWAIVLARS
jgi:hypothetical protein